jgi:predicted outer membrane repeat protein
LDPERLVWFCTLSGNSAADSGGAIYNTGSGNVTLTVSDCTLSGNTAGSAGIGVGIGDGDVILSQCSVTGNSAYQGGGIAIGICGSLATNSTVINHNSPDDIYYDQSFASIC